MRCKSLIILMLVFSMLFLNSSIIFAEETEEHDSQMSEISGQDVSGNSRSINTYIDVDTSNFNGYVKPSTEEYDNGGGIY